MGAWRWECDGDGDGNWGRRTSQLTMIFSNTNCPSPNHRRLYNLYTTLSPSSSPPPSPPLTRSSTYPPLTCTPAASSSASPEPIALNSVHSPLWACDCDCNCDSDCGCGCESDRGCGGSNCASRPSVYIYRGGYITLLGGRERR